MNDDERRYLDRQIALRRRRAARALRTADFRLAPRGATSPEEGPDEASLPEPQAAPR